MRRAGWVVGLLLAALAACSDGGARVALPPSPPPTTGPPPASSPCRGTPAPPRWEHVVWVWMENENARDVLGSGEAPFENRLAAECGTATDYHGVAHPSLPNYLAAVSGTTGGVDSDCSPASCPQHGPTLFRQLGDADRSWRVYAESMPHACDRSASGDYAPKHNPAVYYPELRADCARSDVPLEPALGRDLAAGTLPAFALVVPDLCHDTHDCSVRTGDDWLAAWLPRVLAGRDYRAGRTVVVLTWDEGRGGNHIPTVVVSPATAPGTLVRSRLDHYALLRTTEDLLGLPRLGLARTAPSMAARFGLAPPEPSAPRPSAPVGS